MPRPAEIEYVANMSRVLNVAPHVVEHYLTCKPFCDPARATYLMDIAQLIHFLPPPPARVLDLGCGSGWTSEIMARCGYEVLGVDVAPAMIEIANKRVQADLTLAFRVGDYERPCEFGASMPPFCTTRCIMPKTSGSSSATLFVRSALAGVS